MVCMHVARGFRWPRGRSERSCMTAGTQMRGRVQDVSIGRDQPWLPRMKSNFVMTPSSSKVGFRMPMCGRKW